jgi:hypothetical protein
MGRRRLGDASAMAKMWGFVALTLGALSFMQAHAYVPRDSARSTELPVESCTLIVPEEYYLESFHQGQRALIEHLTGLPRVDLSARPVLLSSTTKGVILETESKRQFRLHRQLVRYQGARYFPLIARAVEFGGGTATGNEAYVLVLSAADLKKLQEIVNKNRRYCSNSTSGSASMGSPGASSMSP